MYGAEIRNRYNSLIVGEGETRYGYAGKTVLSIPANDSSYRKATIINVYNSWDCVHYVHVENLPSTNSVKREETGIEILTSGDRFYVGAFTNAPRTQAMVVSVYTFTTFDRLALPRYGIMVKDSSGKTSWHSGRPPFHIAGIMGVDIGNSTVPTTCTKPACPLLSARYSQYYEAPEVIAVFEHTIVGTPNRIGQFSRWDGVEDAGTSLPTPRTRGTPYIDCAYYDKYG